MASTFGNKLKVSIYGESHADSVGCILEGFPAGFQVNQEKLSVFMHRRASKGRIFDTPRIEKDECIFESGFSADLKTNASPLCLRIENKNTRSKDYDNISFVPRPGHADFAAWKKWGSAYNPAGGGHFSGRLTAAMCAAGGICKQYLEERGVKIAAHILEIGGIRDERSSALLSGLPMTAELEHEFEVLKERSDFPTLSEDAAEKMQQALTKAHEAKDSLGGVVECVAAGFPAGYGEPIFDAIDVLLARALLGIPAVKAVEFGAGTDAAHLRGSANNDAYTVIDGKAYPLTNNAGGILGGLSTGAPIVTAVTFKPISSISREQDSVDLKTMSPAKLAVKGRHDTCAVIRAVPVVEAIMACVLMDVYLSFASEVENN